MLNDDQTRRAESFYNSILSGELIEFRKAPCMECKERYFGCHGKCEKYQSFRKERDMLNDKKVKRQDILYSTQKVTKRRRNTMIEDFKYRRKP